MLIRGQADSARIAYNEKRKINRFPMSAIIKISLELRSIVVWSLIRTFCYFFPSKHRLSIRLISGVSIDIA